MTALKDLPPLDQLRFCPLSTKVWFAGEKGPYTVRARSSRYLVCTKPFNLKRTTFYTVVDLEEGIRGPENLVLGFGAETDEQCVEMVERLHGIVKPWTFKDGVEVEDLPRKVRDQVTQINTAYTGPTEVSHRNRVKLDIEKVKLP